MSIYALKTKSDYANDREIQEQLFNELKQGIARYGWSYEDDADLQLIRKLKSGGNVQSKTPNQEQSYIWKRTSFLLDLEEGDYLVYINLPEYGKCTIAKVLGGGYSFDGGIRCHSEGGMVYKDFRHCLPVQFINTFDRRGSLVHPHLYRRLVLQGNHWQVSAEDEFNDLLKALEEGRKETERTFEITLDQLKNELESPCKEIAKKVLHVFPNKSLEELIEHVLKSIPEVFEDSVKILKGRADKGADLVFEYKNEIVEVVERVAVQAKAYEGKMQYKRAVDDIRRAFDSDDSFTQGLIVSTADDVSDEIEAELDRLRNQSGKPIGLLYGAEFARWVMRHGKELIF